MYKRLRLIWLPVVLSAAAACAVPYKAIGGRTPFDVGYSIEALEGSSYMINYWGGESSDFSRLEDLLHRYADDICLSDPVLGAINRSTFEPAFWTVHYKPGNSIDVSATMECAEVDEALFSESSVAR